MRTANLCLLAVLLLLSPVLTCQAQESDFAVKRAFEDRAIALKARMDAAFATTQLDSLKNDLDAFELDFQSHSVFLDKALYPETFATRVKELRDLHERTYSRVRLIQIQGSQIAEMEAAIQTLTYRLDTLSAARDLLFAELKKNKADVAALRATVQRLQNMLQAQDRLLFALVDSIFMPFGKDLAKVGDVERDVLTSKLSGANIIDRVSSIASENVHFLQATELQGKDYAALIDHYQQFNARWMGLSAKIQAVATASQMPAQSKATAPRTGTGIPVTANPPSTLQAVQVDSIMGVWHIRLNSTFWAAIEREFSSRNITVPPFSDAPGFSTSIRSFAQSLKTSGEDPTVFVEEIWKERIDKEWRDALSRQDMLGKEEYAALDKVVSDLAPSKFDLKFVLYAALILAVVTILWWALSKKPRTPVGTPAAK
jgi:hypothetical protein